MPILMVDSNAHVTAPRELRNRYPLRPLVDSSGVAEEAAEPSVEKLVADMDAARINQAVLIGSRNHGFDNTYCRDAGRRYPDRFATVAGIDIFSSSAVEDVRHWVEEEGMNGVRLWGGGRGVATWVDEERYLPVWRYIDELSVPANAQMTKAECLPGTRRLLERLPSLRLTINNLGHVPSEQGSNSESAAMLLALAEYPNVFVSVNLQCLVDAARAGSPENELLEALLERFGEERLLWTAFYPTPPNTDYAVCAEALREAVSTLSPEVQEGLCGGGARALYPTLRERSPTG